MKEHLIHHAWTFIFTTAMPPYTAEHIGTASRLTPTMNRKWKALFAETQRFSRGLLSRGAEAGQSPTLIVPRIIGENRQAPGAARCLQTQGLAMRAARLSTVPHGSAYLRFSLTSGISDDELVRLESFLNSWGEREISSTAVACA